MMQMEHRLNQSQTQQLVLTQKMQQALHILQLSGIELEQYVQQELETNPFLDKKEREELPQPPKEAPTANSDDNNSFEESFDLDRYNDRLETRFREGRDLSYNEDRFGVQRYYEESITKDESLRAHLLAQLRIATGDPTLYEIGERIIIGDIDNRGYFTGDEDELAAELGVSRDKVDEALAMIQGFDPTGVGAHDVVECLLLQIEAEYPGNDELRVLVRDHLEELKQRQIPKIAKKMSVKPERVEELKRQLAALNPWPGHQYANEPPQYISAEVIVEKVNGDYLVLLSDERLPDLEVQANLLESLPKTGKLSKEEREYVRNKLESARWLKRNITQRQETILKVAEAIVRAQRDFLEKGVEHIRPLKLQDIADEVGMHESTVARTTRGKYMQTPQGLFELKYFFSPGLRTDDGDAQSAKSVQAMVRKIIEEENKRKPLSDQKIADLLKKEGINVARRTVTKYREAMNIPSTTKRREYNA